MKSKLLKLLNIIESNLHLVILTGVILSFLAMIGAIAGLFIDLALVAVLILTLLSIVARVQKLEDRQLKITYLVVCSLGSLLLLELIVRIF